MKTLKSLTLTASLCALFMSSAFALPAWKGGPALETIQKKSDVEKLGPQSQLVLVCKASDTITIIDVKDEKHAKQLCAEGHARQVKQGWTIFQKSLGVFAGRSSSSAGELCESRRIVRCRRIGT